jgi:hypothetical protein
MVQWNNTEGLKIWIWIVVLTPLLGLTSCYFLGDVYPSSVSNALDKAGISGKI